MLVRPLADALVPEKKLGRLSVRGEEREPAGAPSVLAKELKGKCLYVNTVRPGRGAGTGCGRGFSSLPSSPAC